MHIVFRTDPVQRLISTLNPYEAVSGMFFGARALVRNKMYISSR